jgi:hypothetical protein
MDNFNFKNTKTASKNKILSDIKDQNNDLVIAGSGSRQTSTAKKIRDAEDALELKKLENQSQNDYFNYLLEW